MLIFPKLPALRGKRAVYEVNGFVSATKPRWPGDYERAQARLHSRGSADRVELATLNFVSLHGAAAFGEISLQRMDNNGYAFSVKRWTKSAEGWS